MKRVCNVLVLLMCLVVIGGCGDKESSVPEDMSEGMYNLGVKVVKITDKYLNADISLEEAYDELSNLSDQGSKIRDDNKYKDLIVSINISSIESKLWDMKKEFGSKYTDEDVRKLRDELKEYLDIE